MAKFDGAQEDSGANDRSHHGTQKLDLTVSIAAANVYGVAAGLLPALITTFLFLLIWNGRRLAPTLESVTFLIFIVVFVVGAVVHELLHALGWILFGRLPRSAVEIGVKWKLLTPYAHSRQPMPVSGYRWGTALPGLLMGILPSSLAVIAGSGPLLLFGTFFTVVAGGDFLVLWLLREVPKRALVEDHPSRVGCVVTI